MNSVSVIIPVYNVEKYLDECITSILKEIESQDEIILINDGSKDNSLEICKKYEADNDNIVVINNENHGVSYTRNCGIEAAKCEYITFVDSDDYLLPGWREAMGKGAATEKDIVYFGNISDELPAKEELVKSTLCIPSDKPLDLRASACWYKLFRLEFIKQKGITFDTEIINGEDSMFCLDSLLCGGTYSVVNTNEFYFYRTNNASATHTFNEKYNASNLNFIKSVRQKLSASGIFTAEEVKTYVDYLDINGLCILAGRISRIEDSELRRSKFTLFEQPEYLELYKNYIPNALCSKRNQKIFNMLKSKKYKKAMKNILLYRTLINIIKKIVK